MAYNKPFRDLPFVVTNTHYYRHGKDELKVEVMNTLQGLRWRLVVNGQTSPSYGHYEGFLVFKGYFVGTAYWEGDFPPEMTPFRISVAEKVTGD